MPVKLNVTRNRSKSWWRCTPNGCARAFPKSFSEDNTVHTADSQLSLDYLEVNWNPFSGLFSHDQEEEIISFDDDDLYSHFHDEGSDCSTHSYSTEGTEGEGNTLDEIDEKSGTWESLSQGLAAMTHSPSHFDKHKGRHGGRESGKATSGERYISSGTYLYRFSKKMDINGESANSPPKIEEIKSENLDSGAKQIQDIFSLSRSPWFGRLSEKIKGISKRNSGNGSFSQSSKKSVGAYGESTKNDAFTLEDMSESKYGEDCSSRKKLLGQKHTPSVCEVEKPCVPNDVTIKDDPVTRTMSCMSHISNSSSNCSKGINKSFERQEECSAVQSIKTGAGEAPRDKLESEANTAGGMHDPNRYSPWSAESVPTNVSDEDSVHFLQEMGTQSQDTEECSSRHTDLIYINESADESIEIEVSLEDENQWEDEDGDYAISTKEKTTKEGSTCSDDALVPMKESSGETVGIKSSANELEEENQLQSADEGKLTSTLLPCTKLDVNTIKASTIEATVEQDSLVAGKLFNIEEDTITEEDHKGPTSYTSAHQQRATTLQACTKLEVNTIDARAIEATVEQDSSVAGKLLNIEEDSIMEEGHEGSTPYTGAYHQRATRALENITTITRADSRDIITTISSQSRWSTSMFYRTTMRSSATTATQPFRVTKGLKKKRRGLRESNDEVKSVKSTRSLPTIYCSTIASTSSTGTRVARVTSSLKKRRPGRPEDDVYFIRKEGAKKDFLVFI